MNNNQAEVANEKHWEVGKAIIRKPEHLVDSDTRCAQRLWRRNKSPSVLWRGLFTGVCDQYNGECEHEKVWEF